MTDFSEISRTVLWLVACGVFSISEAFLKSYVLVFLGLASLVVVIFRLAGLEDVGIEWGLFIAFSTAGLIGFRKAFLDRATEEQQFYEDSKEKVMLTEDIPARRVRSISYQGNVWSACNDSDTDLRQGEMAILDRTENLRLYLKPIPLHKKETT